MKLINRKKRTANSRLQLWRVTEELLHRANNSQHIGRQVAAFYPPQQ